MPEAALRVESPADIRGGQTESRKPAARALVSEYSESEFNVAGTATSVGTVPKGTTNVPPLVQTSWALRATRMIPAAMYVWLTSSLAVLCISVVRGHYFWQLLRTAKPAPEQLQSETERLAKSIGLRRYPQVLLLPANLSPMVWAPYRRVELPCR